MKHGSLFSGIGGFDLAASWMGWENVFHCEINPFCQTVLKHHFPKSISYDDIKKTDFTIHRGGIDILTGGFPCQPYSQAGKRLGKEDERHLWPEMLRAIQEIQPSYVVGENVRGLINWNGGVVFDEVQSDLEAEGYEVLPFLLPACAVNAPHRRDRVWFVAYSRHNTERKARNSGNDEGSEFTTIHTEGQGRKCEAVFNSGLCDLQGDVTDPRLFGQEKCEKQTAGIEQCNKGDAMHTNSTSEQREHIGQKREGEFNGPDSRDGFNNFQNFPTESPICGRNDGLPSQLDGITLPKWRNESIKGYGNAIVPQVILQIFKAIESI